MGHGSCGDDIGNRLAQVFSSLPGRRNDRCQGGRIASCSTAERRCAIRIAKGAALLGEPFAGHCQGIPGTLGDHLAFTLGDRLPRHGIVNR
jgi:hypothetical protein